MKSRNKGFAPEKSVRNQLHRKFIEQRLMGVGMIIISIAIICVAIGGKTAEERDATAVFFTLPMGITMLFSKDIIIF